MDFHFYFAVRALWSEKRGHGGTVTYGEGAFEGGDCKMMSSGAVTCGEGNPLERGTSYLTTCFPCGCQPLVPNERRLKIPMSE